MSKKLLKKYSIKIYNYVLELRKKVEKKEEGMTHNKMTEKTN